MKTIKHKLGIITLLLLLLTAVLPAQTEGVSIKSSAGAPHASAMLDVESTTKGILIPRVALTNFTSTSMMATTPSSALLVYNTTSNSTVTPGFYYWSGSVWKQLATGAELWTKIGTTNNIHYTGGKVVVGNAAAVTPTFQFHVLEGSSNAYGFRADALYNSQLRFGFYDQDGESGGGPGNWLSQKSSSVVSGGQNWTRGCRTTHLGGIVNGGLNTGLMFTSYAKPNGTLGGCHIGSNNNNLFISSGGTITIAQPNAFATFTTGGFWIPASDSSLKQSVATQTSVLSALGSLRPVTYKFKSQPDGQLQHGFIAQEIEAIFPELVVNSSTPNYTEDEELGPKISSYTTKKGLNYMGLISVLVKAIQEQQALINDLDARLDAMGH